MRVSKLLYALIPVLLAIITGVGQLIARAASPPGGGSENLAYQNEVLGVSLQALPPNTRVVEDQYLSDAYGFTVVDPEGRTVLRVAWRHRDAPNQMEQRVQELIRGFPNLYLRAEPVLVGSFQGMMIPDAPGMDPSTYIYVTANGRLYEIICPQREGWMACKKLLNQLIFSPASQTLEELRLIRAEDVLYEKPPAQETPSPKGVNGDGCSYFWQRRGPLLRAISGPGLCRLADLEVPPNPLVLYGQRLRYPLATGMVPGGTFILRGRFTSVLQPD